jgi:hypothetical protein
MTGAPATTRIDPECRCSYGPIALAQRDAGRFIWFLATSCLPPGSPPSYSPPIYLFAPGLWPCDAHLIADHGSVVTGW